MPYSGPLPTAALDPMAEEAPEQAVGADLVAVRGRGYPAPDAPEGVKANYLTNLLRQGEADALARYKQGARNILYDNDRQRIGWKGTSRLWDDLPVAEGDWFVTANYISVALRARIQRLVSSEISWRVIPESDSYQDRDNAKVAVDFLKSRWSTLDMEHKARQGLRLGALTGVAALKSFWNPSIGPLTAASMMFPEPVTDPQTGLPVLDPTTGQPAVQQVEHFVDESGQPVESEEQAFHYRPGDTDTGLRTWLNLRLNPEAQGWTEGEGFRWLIDEEVVPLSVARERYIKIASKIRASEGLPSAVTYERLVRGSNTQRPAGFYNTSAFTSTSTEGQTDDLTVIREYWEVRSRFFPKGRLIVIVGGAEAYDGPWPCEVLPYAPLFGEPGVMAAYGRSPVNAWLPLQDVLNRQLTAVSKEMVQSGTGKFAALDLPGVADQISSGDDAVVRIPARALFGNRSIRDVMMRLDPAQVSGDRWRLIERTLSSFFDIAAYHEVSRGQIPPGLDSGVAIQYLLETESTQLKEAVEAFKKALIQWARHQIAVARWGYTDDRWIPVSRPDLGYRVMSVTGTQLPDAETVGLDIEYFRPQSESATRAEVKELLALGMIDPRKGLQIMDLGSGFEEAYASQSRHYSRARWENIAFEGQAAAPYLVGMDPATGQPVVDFQFQDGSPFLLAEDDDHLIHIDAHDEVLLDPTKPWAVRQAVMQHIANHRRAVIQAQVRQAQIVGASQAMAQGPSLLQEQTAKRQAEGSARNTAE